MSIPQPPGNVDLIRVVIVEDTAMLRGMMVKAFNETGRYRVVGEAAEGQSGIDVAREQVPDLIMLDLQMRDGMDGLTALPQLRELLPEARIVIFTGYDELVHRDELLAAGATDAIGKGTRLAEVISQIDRHFC